MLWTTPQFGFVRLSDAFSTGSSIMPQKRNPDAAELVRGKTGRIVGALIGLLTVMKGLPLAYSKDMQEDKEGAFDAFRTLALCLAAMTGMVEDLTPEPKRMKAAAGAGYATATDLADWLVQALKMPFREAHHITGRIVALAAKRGVALEKLTLAEMQSVEPRITEEAFGVLGVERSVKSRTSYGGTAPANVRRQAKGLAETIGQEVTCECPESGHKNKFLPSFPHIQTSCLNLRTSRSSSPRPTFPTATGPSKSQTRTPTTSFTSARARLAVRAAIMRSSRRTGRGRCPPGVIEHRVPTNTVMFAIRIGVVPQDSEDLKKVDALQDEFKTTTLSNWGDPSKIGQVKTPELANRPNYRRSGLLPDCRRSPGREPAAG